MTLLGMVVVKHQQVSLPAAIPQWFGPPQSGQRSGLKTEFDSVALVTVGSLAAPADSVGGVNRGPSVQTPQTLESSRATSGETDAGTGVRPWQVFGLSSLRPVAGS
jgi:hypothetical protein